MSNFAASSLTQAISLPSEHGPLHGTLSIVENSPGIVVLVHAALSLDGRDGLLAARLRHAGLSTLSIDLLALQEERFSDVHNNVPLLCKRLLDFLGLLKHRMLLGEIAPQPLGLCAAHATSPVVVRAASLRDHDIAALVCRGGLIDRAGALYLRSLAAPLLMLVEEDDARLVTASERALREVSGQTVLKVIPEVTIDYAVSPGFEQAAALTSAWFIDHFPPVTRQKDPAATAPDSAA